MFKLIKTAVTFLLVISLVCLVAGIKDLKTLQENLIRLHVVADSDSQQAQAVKLQVKDAVVSYLQQALDNIPDVETAKAFLREKLGQIKAVADEVLTAAGVEERAEVSLEEETFSTRDYDTFSLPAGIYESLRIVIGDGEGKNWWCVVFPSLCLPATGEGFADAAVGAGFDNTLTSTLQKQEGYQIRFFLLDCLGWVENLFHRK